MIQSETVKAKNNFTASNYVSLELYLFYNNQYALFYTLICFYEIDASIYRGHIYNPTIT